MRKRRSNTTSHEGQYVEVGKYYRRYDGKVVEIIAIAEDSESGVEMVVFRTRHEDLLEVDEKIYTCTAEFFLGAIKIQGSVRSRYREVLIGATLHHDQEWMSLLESSPVRANNQYK